MSITGSYPEQCATYAYRTVRCVREGGHEGQHGYPLSDLAAVATLDLKRDLDYANEQLKLLKDSVTPLVVAARNFVNNDDDTGALEALVEASDMTKWTVLDMLGIKEDQD